MNAPEIHALLRERFGDAIADWVAPEAGDPVIAVRADGLHAVCAFLRDADDLRFDLLRMVSGVDWGDHISSVYHLYSLARGHSVAIRVDLDRSAPRAASVADLWPAAEWHEREAYDLVGVVYEGHPNLRRILLPEDWAGHPLRKDYVAPREYNGLPVGDPLRNE
jgi:NADH-quinone oxidoreductase subunit C